MPFKFAVVSFVLTPTFAVLFINSFATIAPVSTVIRAAQA